MELEHSEYIKRANSLLGSCPICKGTGRVERDGISREEVLDSYGKVVNYTDVLVKITRDCPSCSLLAT